MTLADLHALLTHLERRRLDLLLELIPCDACGGHWELSIGRRTFIAATPGVAVDKAAGWLRRRAERRES